MKDFLKGFGVDGGSGFRCRGQGLGLFVFSGEV